MVLRESKNAAAPSQPARASATPVLDALLKIESGNQLTDSECSRLCRIVFMPAISRKYQWTKSRVGISSDSRRRLPDEIEESVEPDPSDVEASGPEEVPATENQEYHRDPFCDPVFTTAISELWARFSPQAEPFDAGNGENVEDGESAEPDPGEDGEPDAGPTLSIWQHALQAALRESDPDVRETAAIRYLRTCAWNELIKWLQEGGCWFQLRQRLQKVVAGGGYTVLRAGARGKGLSMYDRLVPAGHENWPTLKNCPPYELSRDLTFPSLRGGSQGLLSLLPTPQQFHEFLQQFFRVHRAAATVQQLMLTAQTGWKIHDDKKLGLPDDATSDSEEDNENKPSGEETVKLSSPPNRPPDPIETAAAHLIAAIEVADGCPIDPPPDNPKAGKLGRLLLQYAIWAGLPCTDTESGKYGIERYAQLTGYGKTMENDRYHQQLAVIFQKLAQDYAYNRQMIVDLTVWLREEYFHRKPETVIFDALTHGEQ